MAVFQNSDTATSDASSDAPWQLGGQAPIWSEWLGHCALTYNVIPRTQASEWEGTESELIMEMFLTSRPTRWVLAMPAQRLRLGVTDQKVGVPCALTPAS